MTFTDKLRAAQAATRSRVCVGLDPDPARLPRSLRDLPPADAVLAFNRAIIDATADIACAFKPNLAFYEALGADGWHVFAETVAMIPDGRLVIADAKRGDIGNTARMYARAFFEGVDADAVTVSPYMGSDAITPFLETEGRCAFVLVATSNPSGPELQALVADGEPVYRRTARLAVEAAAERPGEAGFVVGATRPELLAEIRAAHPDVPFLVPGVGAQGGDAAAVVAAAGSGPLLVNSSRGILYASDGDDFAAAARRATESLREALGDPNR
ncbi:MAG: orotidine-5'-phosphate decarboxylase [Rhodothermales bacterium]